MRKHILIPEHRPLYAMRKCFGPTQGPLTQPTPTPVDVIGQLLLQKGKEALTIYEVKVDPTTRKTCSEPVKLTMENYRLPYDEIVGKPDETGELGAIVTDEVGKRAVVTPTIVPDDPAVDGELLADADVPAGWAETPIQQMEAAEAETEAAVETEEDVQQFESVEPAGEAVEEREVQPEELTGIDSEDVNEEPEVEVEPEVESAEEETEETEEAVDDEVDHDETDASAEEATQNQVDPYAGMTKAERKAARRAAAAQAAQQNQN